MAGTTTGYRISATPLANTAASRAFYSDQTMAIHERLQ